LDLSAVLADFPDFHIASEKDEPEILRFFNATKMVGGGLQLRTVRGPRFSSFLDLQSDERLVLYYRKPGGPIAGVAAFVFRPGYIDGKETKTLYLGDFRIEFDRALVRSWRKFYARLLEAIDCPAITAVIDDNKRARNALVISQGHGFSYEPLCSYRMVNFLRPWPWRSRKIPPQIRRATAADEPELIRFLDQEQRKKSFGYVMTSEWDRRKKSWPGFSIERFWIWRENGAIEGCLFPWSPSPTKYNVIEQAPLSIQLLRPLIRFPMRGDELKTLYMTHFEVSAETKSERTRRAQGLLRAALEEGFRGDWNMISYCDFLGDQFDRGFHGYLSRTVPMQLYQVLPETKKRESSSSVESAGFEMALV
jgi:hypothetical protein